MRLALTRSRRSSLFALVLALALGATLLALSPRPASQTDSAAAEECPPGYFPASEEDVIAPDVASQLPAQYRGPAGADVRDVLRKVACISHNAPESFQEMALREREASAVRTAPFASVAQGANAAAAAQREELMGADVEGADGTYEPYGEGPLIFDDERFNQGQIAGLGLGDATGRIDDLQYDEETGQLFAAIGTGGIWVSDDLGDTFRSISDSLPTQVVGAVDFTPVGGPDGTVVTITGEHTFGGNGYIGMGAYFSRDMGETWQKSGGVPDGGLGFTIEVDPTDPNVVYVGTQFGMYRSGDAGATYENVVLPTGDCAQTPLDRVNCNFANMVTDIVIKEPGGIDEANEGGTVVAAVGWRAGMMEEVDGDVQSPSNGIYRSDTGDVGSFERDDGLDRAVVGGRERLGRIEMGAAVGPEQDHDFLYAIVEDAVLFNGGIPAAPVPGEIENPAGNATVLNGVYSSDDFGESWTLLADDNELSNGCPANGSALCIPGLVQPGIQSWYDLWIEPDPSVQAVGGIPSRVVFGIEEVWQNVRGVAAEDVGVEAPVNSDATTFEVFGRYFSGDTCALGLLPTVAGQCAVSRPPSGTTTPHPDQHAGTFVPTETGTALLIGHDGGFSRQDVGPGEEFNNGDWQLDQDNGLRTLLPYSAVIANDGVAWAGLQDNGHMKIVPEEGFQQFVTFGGDGTFAAVDPEDSDYAFESVQGGRVNVTSDGGLTWADAESPAEGKRFVNPFVMDPLDSDHVVTGGFTITETLSGRETRDGEDGGWIEVFDLNVREESPDDAESGDVNVEVENGMSAVDTRGDATYVGFCGVCDILNAEAPFASGIATNVGGDQPPEKGTPNGWHTATAEGLPDRFVTNVTIDPDDPETVYVALGGYSRRWVPPGSSTDMNDNVGEGHIFKSTDAGETFTDISGDLPDIPAAWIEPRGDQLVVGTDNGVYISSDTEGGPYAVLGGDQLPSLPISSLQLKPDDPDFLLVGTYGRGLFQYTFPEVEPGDGDGDGDPDGPDVPGTSDVDIRRLSGLDRVQTSILTSQQGFEDGSADAVVLARADVYADALAGAPYARQLDAPILLTPSGELGDGVAEEIDRLGAQTVYLLGGTAAISAEVEQGLEDDGFTVERVGGENRFATSGLIADEVGGTDVYVAEGADPDPSRGWPDALSVAPLAAHQQRPIMLVTTESLPVETQEALDRLGVDNATVVGGTDAVSSDVEDAVEAEGAATARVGGANRFATSALVGSLAEKAGLSVAQTWLSRGSDWPDALSSGPTVAKTEGILLLVGDDDLDDSPETRDFLARRACDVEVLRILGGVEAISPSVEDQLAGLFTNCVAPDGGPGDEPGTGDPGDEPGSGDPGGEPGTDPGEPEPQPQGETLAGPFGFEEDAEGWTVEPGMSFEGTPGNPGTSWERIEPGAGSEISFGVAPYLDLSGTNLVSPELTSPGGLLFLSFSNAFDIEGAGFDEVAVEWSSDAEEWNTIASLGGMSDAFPEFSTEQLSFEAPEGPLFIRFRFFSDQICSSVGTPVCARPDGYEGVRIDDILLER